MTTPLPPKGAPSRYAGEFVVEDIANNKKYIADLLFSQRIGDPLTGWTLGGTTQPTIDSDGKIDLFDNTPLLADQNSQLYRAIPNTTGEFHGVLHLKFERQADDDSTDTRGELFQVSTSTSRSRGFQFDDLRNGNSQLLWVNSGGLGIGVTFAFIAAISVEYTLDMVMTSEKAIILIDGVHQAEVPLVDIGTLPLSSQQLVDFRSGNKIILFHVQHDADETSHVKIHDVKYGRLVGVSSR